MTYSREKCPPRASSPRHETGCLPDTALDQVSGGAGAIATHVMKSYNDAQDNIIANNKS